MEEFIKKIVLLILGPEVKFEISSSNEDDINVYTILAPEEEIGKLIGKGGKVVNAIRNICRIKSMQNQEKFLIKVDLLQ